MKKFSLILILSGIFLVSCQKDISWDPSVTQGGGNTDTTGTGGNNSGSLLVKTVSVQNSESYTTTYTYTADKKIDVINTTGTSGGLDVGNYRRFYRDATGRITRIATKVPPQSGIEVDTVFMNVHYPDAATFNYDYTVQKISLSGFDIYDSTTYTYNANNQVTEGYTHQYNPILGPVQDLRSVYSYDASGNLIKIEGYNNATGNMELTVTFDLEYDNKTNPAAFDKQEMLVSGGNPGSSKNNVTVMTFKDVAGNEPEQIINNVYTFGSNGLPSKVVATDQSGFNPVTTTTFYYQ